MLASPALHPNHFPAQKELQRTNNCNAKNVWSHARVATPTPKPLSAQLKQPKLKLKLKEPKAGERRHRVRTWPGPGPSKRHPKPLRTAHPRPLRTAQKPPKSAQKKPPKSAQKSPRGRPGRRRAPETQRHSKLLQNTSFYRIHMGNIIWDIFWTNMFRHFGTILQTHIGNLARMV